MNENNAPAFRPAVLGVMTSARVSWDDVHGKERSRACAGRRTDQRDSRAKRRSCQSNGPPSHAPTLTALPEFEQRRAGGSGDGRSGREPLRTEHGPEGDGEPADPLVDRLLVLAREAEPHRGALRLIGEDGVARRDAHPLPQGLCVQRPLVDTASERQPQVVPAERHTRVVLTRQMALESLRERVRAGLVERTGLFE